MRQQKKSHKTECCMHLGDVFKKKEVCCNEQYSKKKTVLITATITHQYIEISNKSFERFTQLWNVRPSYVRHHCKHFIFFLVQLEKQGVMEAFDASAAGKILRW